MMTDAPCDSAAGRARGGRPPERTKPVVEQDEYPPSEDTFFLADYIGRAPRGLAALDVGSGSGYITRLLRDSFGFVVGTDINCRVLRNQSGAYRTENLVCCSGSDAIRAEFDLAVCNPPYLATDSVTFESTDGGPGGLEVPARILDSVFRNVRPGGRFAIVTSTLSDYDGLMGHAVRAGFADARIVARKKLFFEELLLVECSVAAATGA